MGSNVENHRDTHSDAVATKLESGDREQDDGWINYTDMDTNRYTTLLTVLGVASTIVTHPLNVVVTRQQVGAIITGDPISNTSFTSCIRDIIKRFGWKGIFRGWAVVAAVGIPSQIVYMNLTELSREQLQLLIRNTYPKLDNIFVDGVQSVLSSIAASTMSLLVFVPAEVVSSKLIVRRHVDNMNSLEMMKKIYLQNGVAGFYKGYFPSLVVGSVFSANWWWIYSMSRRQLKQSHFSDSYSPVFADMTAGLFSGLGAGVVAHPFDTIKTRIMTAAHGEDTSFYKSMSTVYRNEGMKALFRGLMPSLYLTCISSTGFAVAYEVLKKLSSDDDGGTK